MCALEQDTDTVSQSVASASIYYSNLALAVFTDQYVVMGLARKALLLLYGEHKCSEVRESVQAKPLLCSHKARPEGLTPAQLKPFLTGRKVLLQLLPHYNLC